MRSNNFFAKTKILSFFILLSFGLTLMACQRKQNEMQKSQQAGYQVARSDTVQVDLVEFKIDMPTTLSAGKTIFRVSNVGQSQHNIEFVGKGIDKTFETNLAAGETRIMEIDLTPGVYHVYCPVGSHEVYGMKMDLTVTE